MKFIVGILVAICGNCFTFISVYAADSASPVTRNKPSNSATPRKAPSVSNIGIALSDSFDTSQTNLPQRFEGHDVEALFKKVYLRRNEYKKDQFETKQAFKERTDKLSEELAPSSIALGVKVPASYDAEKGRF